ncbi:PAS domain-containing protein [Aliivibrio fischeri]|uniref:methyl-accepting chemotaxis protein n=1 Tax=Aliivibrio fischeri TaxID=668 RepID=UPI0012D91AEE|nr:PAS domain-containing methyl-accepting chemotaxis protein [Aliivibrio fischeri]MUK36456.1 PAS domain-containing protein [Aliivibrio fischeri]MUL05749.1 PAS domain-containing protein [Aliivibrio fischeri]
MKAASSTYKEVLFPKEYNLLSITSPSSHITYASKEFCEVAGFTLDELTTQPHNIVRHPDMPSEAFKDMWSHLKNKKSWMGLVKNKCKDGNYYWVDAFASPILQNGEIKEYQSVRLSPSREHISNAEKVYASLKSGKKPLKLTLPRTRLWQRFALTLIPSFIVAALISYQWSPLFGLSLLSTLSLLSVYSLTRRLEQLSTKAKAVFDNPLMELIYTNHVDDISEIELALKMRQSEINAIIGRIQDSNEQIETLAKSSTSNCLDTVNNLNEQTQETNQVANAIQEMSASVNDIAANVLSTAQATEEAYQVTSEGMTTVTETVNSIQMLSTQLTNASNIIATLEARGNEIGSVLTVIQAIAEQTNLLALNAAIEAARAGEQGRGFAVVADEVRALAQRSQDSAKEIQDMIKQIQQSTQDAVEAMEQGKSLSSVCVDSANKSGHTLQESFEQVSAIAEKNTQISVAIEQIVKVSEDMNTNIQSINNVCEHTHNIANETMKVCNTLSETIDSQGSLVAQFRNV